MNKGMIIEIIKLFEINKINIGVMVNNKNANHINFSSKYFSK